MARRSRITQPKANDLLTEAQVQAEELPMSLAWFRSKRLCGGGPPFIRVSNRVFYRRSDLLTWIQERAVDQQQGGR
jgi:hypothetical protein